MDRVGFNEGGSSPILSDDQKQYIEFYNMAVKAGLDFPEAVAAQASLESGHGKSELTTKYNNPLGIKVKRLSEIDTQEAVNMATREVEEGKDVVRIEPFRVFKNIEESFLGYKDKISVSRYNKAREAKNADEYLKAIQNSGYATDPEYAQKTINIKNRYKNLIKSKPKPTLESPMKIEEVVLPTRVSLKERLAKRAENA
tara:strand:- start:36 stop:632 length:597 start_codon:yes stop_codon:yes gene_type:complete